ncbi:molybdopterin-dependent oxidoreductase [Dongia sp.]|uniref:molybdopterin-dependent oxidoreductase n=1 Tax=Dongia sp. TaxID=1977262 RepID=UPI0035B3F721
MPLLRAITIGAVLLLGLSVPALALDPLPAPQGPVLLTVAGKIAIGNTPGGRAEFDLDMLRALPRSGFATSTIWTDGVQRFEGVLVADLLARLGATASEIDATAANDYEIRFPAADATEHGALIAYAANGAPLPDDNKGPLWIVYPYDRDEALRSERFISQSVWSLETMTVY